MTNVIAFSVWEILYNLVSMQNLCLKIAEVSKIAKSVQCDLTFIFIELSETANSFMKIPLVLEIKIVVSFIKTRFYWKWGCIKMHKHAEAFHASFIQLPFLYQLCFFQNRNLRYSFQRLFAQKWGLEHLYILYENESL